MQWNVPMYECFLWPLKLFQFHAQNEHNEVICENYFICSILVYRFVHLKADYIYGDILGFCSDMKLLLWICFCLLFVEIFKAVQPFGGLRQTTWGNTNLFQMYKHNDMVYSPLRSAYSIDTINHFVQTFSDSDLIFCNQIIRRDWKKFGHYFYRFLIEFLLVGTKYDCESKISLNGSRQALHNSPSTEWIIIESGILFNELQVIRCTKQNCNKNIFDEIILIIADLKDSNRFFREFSGSVSHIWFHCLESMFQRIRNIQRCCQIKHGWRNCWESTTLFSNSYRYYCYIFQWIALIIAFPEKTLVLKHRWRGIKIPTQVFWGLK